MWRIGSVIGSATTSAMRSAGHTQAVTGRLFHAQAAASAVRPCGPVAIAATAPVAVLQRHAVARSTALRTAIPASAAAPRARCFSRLAARHSSAASSAPSASSSAGAAAASIRPGGWVCPLSDEAVLRLSAAPSATTPLDLLKFLHNLTTCDVYSLAASGGAGYTVFLNARGRVMFDACLHPIDEASKQWMAAGARPGTLVQRGAAGIDRAGAMLPTSAADFPAALSARSPTPRGFYLSLPRASVPLALDHLRQYNLRRKVVVEDVSAAVQVSQIVPFSVLHPTAAATMTTAAAMVGVSDAEMQPNASLLHAMIDPRCPQLGVRTLTRRDADADAAAAAGALSFLPSSFTPVTDPTFFDAYRILQGIPRAPLEIQADKSLPLELGLLDMGRHSSLAPVAAADAAANLPPLPLPTPAPVSFEKGCYLGQELTARTHFQGVVRKRIWPMFAVAAAAGSANAAAAQVVALQGQIIGAVNASILAAASVPPRSAVSPSEDAVTAAAFRDLQSFFPLFDPTARTSPLLPRDTPIVRCPIAAAAGGSAPATPAAATPSKEVARVLSSQHNVCLALLRSEHVEEHSQVMQPLMAQATEGEASAAPQMILLPFQPDWWSATAEPAAEATATAASPPTSAPSSLPAARI